jgi:hypothetical protein
VGGVACSKDSGAPRRVTEATTTASLHCPTRWEYPVSVPVIGLGSEVACSEDPGAPSSYQSNRYCQSEPSDEMGVPIISTSWKTWDLVTVSRSGVACSEVRVCCLFVSKEREENEKKGKVVLVDALKVKG